MDADQHADAAEGHAQTLAAAESIRDKGRARFEAEAVDTSSAIEVGARGLSEAPFYAENIAVDSHVVLLLVSPGARFFRW